MNRKTTGHNQTRRLLLEKSISQPKTDMIINSYRYKKKMNELGYYKEWRDRLLMLMNFTPYEWETKLFNALFETQTQNFEKILSSIINTSYYNELYSIINTFSTAWVFDSDTLSASILREADYPAKYWKDFFDNSYNEDVDSYILNG